MLEPYAFATQSGQIVLKRVLDQYALKSDRGPSIDPFNKIVAEKDDNNIEQSSQSPEVGSNSYGEYGLIQPPYNPKLLSDLSDLNTYHSSACKTKAVDVAGLGWRLDPIGDNPDPAHKQDLLEFFHNCKPFIEEILTRAAQDEEEIGFGSLELIREGGLVTGQPKRLEHIHGHTIRIHKSRKKYMQTWDGQNRVWFKAIGEFDQDGNDFDVNKETGEIAAYNSLGAMAANELIFNYNYTSKSSYYGTPDYIPAIRTMIGDQAAVDYNLVFFKNFGIPAYAVYITGNFVDEPLLDDDNQPTGKTKMQSAMEAKFKEVIENPHGSMVFLIPTKNSEDKVEVKFEKLSVETKESSFRLYRLDNRDEIVAAHRIDPHQIGINISGPLGGDTARQSNKNYKNRVISPKQRRWEALINIYIIWSDNGFGFKDWEFKLISIDTDDVTMELDVDYKLFMIGSARPIDILNKWAAKRNFNIPEEIQDHPAMNAYYINNYPITLEAEAEIIDTQGEDVPGVLKILTDLKDGLVEVNEKYVGADADRDDRLSGRFNKIYKRFTRR